MSLTQRVQAAGNAEREAVPNDVRALETLRDGVRTFVSADAIAQLMTANPQRAKNEIRRACTQVFAENPLLPTAPSQQEILIERLLDGMFGFGPIEPLLEDESITEIMVNGATSLYYERDGRLFRGESLFGDNAQVRTLIDRIIGPLGRRIDEQSPMVDARLPQGHRVHAVIPPIALDGPVITIRKFKTRVMTLDQMVQARSFDNIVRRFLSWCVKDRRNIAVSGGTGSGKTTLLNALSCEISKDERIVTIEDSAELRFSEHPHVVRLESRAASIEGVGAVTIRCLVANALRMRPDRIVVGECRGEEALDMLQAMNTGHDGSLTTLHANSPADAIHRLSTMVGYAADLPLDAIEAQIASALDIIVQTARASDGTRYVSDIAEVEESADGRACTVVPVYRFDRVEDRGVWLRVPSVLQTLDDDGVVPMQEVDRWKRECSLCS